MFKKSTRFILLSTLLIFLFGQGLHTHIYAEATEHAFTLEGATSSFLYDASSGIVLYENLADEPRPPASMSKMMTYYLVMDAIRDGKVQWEDQVTASAYASWITGTKIGVKKGDQYSVRDLVYAMMIISANDAAIMLAEHVAGTEEAFAKRMTQKAKELGLSSHAHFINATGLGRHSLGIYHPKSISGETMLTARDTAMLAHHLLTDYPELLNITSTAEWQLNEETILRNSNLMLESSHYRKDGENPYLYPGMDGLKTGYINAAGNTFTGTAVRDGVRLISVVMGTESPQARFEKTRELLDYGFAQYHPVKLLKAGENVKAQPTISILNGDKDEIPVVMAQDVIFSENVHYEPSTYEVVVDRRVTLPFDAPIKKGDRVGVATVLYRGSVQQVDLIAAEDVHELDGKVVAGTTGKTMAGKLIDGSMTKFTGNDISMDGTSRTHKFLDMLKQWVNSLFTHNMYVSN